jgi:sulfite reductase (NADPH) flavoprotein alpha-component
MIGAGTGVAPFRAFMQEREARGANGRSWLFFGDRHFRTDFLYQTEWQRLLKDKLLTRMDVAFSRDRRSDGEAKAYVQHRLKAHARDVFAWLEEGAHLYVCGDAKRLAPDIHRTLAEIVAGEGGFGPEATQDYLQRLQRERRYQRDVY